VRSRGDADSISAERALVVAGDAVDDAPTLTEEAWLLAGASQVLLRTEEVLRQHADDRDEMASCRASLSWALGLVRCAADVLRSDARGAVLDDAAHEIVGAMRELADDDLAGAADTVARVAHTVLALNAAQSAEPARKAEVERATT
jgi:hypothetical protein